MVALNEVKIRVRSNALDLIEFTVEKMQQVTGLNPASIRTELTRMKREGYLTSSPRPGVRQGRGAPPHLYRLTDDDDQLDELVRSVEAFYQPAGLASSKPTSLHYEAAQTLLDQLETGQLPPTERRATLARVADHLELATADEGVAVWPDEKTEVVAAYLALLHARLAIARGHWRKAARRLAEARSTFTGQQVDDGLQQTVALANALTMEKTMADAPDDTSLFQRLLTALQGQRGHVPVTTICRVLAQAQATAMTAAAKSSQEWTTETARQRSRIAGISAIRPESIESKTTKPLGGKNLSNSTEQKASGIFVDLEDMALVGDRRGVLFDISPIMDRVGQISTPLLRKSYGDWAQFAKYVSHFRGEAFDLVQLSGTASVKNSVDNQLPADVLEAIFLYPHITTIFLVTGNSHYSPLVRMLRKDGRYVIGIGWLESTDMAFREHCDEFWSYEEIADLLDKG